ncbi:aromatic amino acid transaminase [Streptomyces sp. NPDC056291]|uniref:aromatic amino acid transaminase n=1 Tax=unclassified Streptomyces TaxID=2593676 RepID=UPI0035D662AA
MFTKLPDPTLDPIWAVARACRADQRPNRLDLGIGVYRDDNGATSVMRAVDAAQRRLADLCDSKAYYPSASGHQVFTDAMTQLVLGAHGQGRTTAVQTVGGTGALHLLSTLAVTARPGTRILVGTPTYVNHEPLFRNAGLEVVTFPFLDSANRPSVTAIIDAVQHARRGDLLLIQGCCHNPTGTELQAAEWAAVTDAVIAAGVVPFIDVAYYGLGNGLEQDLAGTRYIAERVPETLIAVSAAKAFGLYNERVGLALVLTDPSRARTVRGTLENIARIVYSQPPHHGAAIVADILGDPVLRANWASELDSMRRRIDRLRAGFLDELAPEVQERPEWQALRSHRGMFTTLPLGREAMVWLREDFAVYGTDGGRLNIAGLPAGRVSDLAAAVSAVAAKAA